MDSRNVVIVVLLLVCAALGYFVYQSQKPGIEIKAPGVDIRAK